MNEILLSVIIPFFNSNIQAFAKCIASVQHFLIPYEIIAVDDGSDNAISLECRQLLSEISSAKYLRQANAGVSAARNYGMQNSTGKYVLFLDSDDELSPKITEFINHNFTSFSADLLFFGFIKKDLVHNTDIYQSILTKEKFEQQNALFSVDYQEVLKLRVATRYFNTCTAKLIRNELIKNNHISFPVGMLNGEDALFNTRLLSVVKTIQCIPIYGYIYNYEPRQIERLLRNPKKKYQFYIQNHSELLELLENRATHENQKKLLDGNKSVMSIELLQDCLVLAQQNQLTSEAKELIFYTAQRVGLFENFSARKCHSLKTKVYWSLLRYRQWYFIKCIAVLKTLLHK